MAMVGGAGIGMDDVTELLGAAAVEEFRRRCGGVRVPERDAAPRRTDPASVYRRVAGGILRSTRRDAGLTLGELSGKAGLSLGYISEIELGKKNASPDLIAAAVEAAGLEFGDFLIMVGEAMQEERHGGSATAKRPDYEPVA